MVEQDLKRLVWLASYPKSGNTWMRMLFAAYQGFGNSTFKLSDAYRTTRSASRRSDFETLIGKKELTVQEIDENREAVQLEIARTIRPPVLLKSHDARVQHNGFPIISRQYTLGAIYIVRNPLDLVDSLADHMGDPVDVAIDHMGNRNYSIGGPNSTLVSQYLSTWSGHVTSWTGPTPFPVHIVRYEDLKANPQVVFRNVVTFLGWNPDPKRLRFAIEQTEFNRLQRLENEQGFRETSDKSTTGRFFREGKSGDWQSRLSEHQIQRICDDHGVVMQDMGYETPQTKSRKTGK